MATPAISETKPLRRWLSPRFSLRMLFLFVTAAAIGSAFWWRWPITVTTEKTSGSGRVEQEINNYHRDLGSNRIKHGAHRVTRDGDLVLDEHYQEGSLHGPYQQKLWGDGMISGEYFAGKKHGTWKYIPSDIPVILKSGGNSPLSVVWPAQEFYRVEEHWNRGRRDGLFQWWDQAGKLCFRYEFKDDRLLVQQGNQPSLLMRRISGEESSDAKLQHALVQRCDLFFVNTPLHKVMSAIKEKYGVRLVLCSRRIAIPSELLDFPFEREESRATEQWLKAVPTLRNANLFRDAPVRIMLTNVPLHAGLEAMLAPLGMVLDYRYGQVCIVDAEGAEDWEAATGVLELHPPASSPLAVRLDQPAKPIPPSTVRRALGNLAEMQEIPLELRFEKEHLAAREYLDSWLDLPFASVLLSEEQAAVLKLSDEPLPAESPLTLRQLLGLILDQANLHCHEENGVLIIEPPQKQR